MIYYINTEQYKKALKKVVGSPINVNKGNKTVNLEGYLKNNMDKMHYLKYKNKN